MYQISFLLLVLVGLFLGCSKDSRDFREDVEGQYQGTIYFRGPGPEYLILEDSSIFLEAEVGPQNKSVYELRVAPADNPILLLKIQDFESSSFAIFENQVDNWPDNILPNGIFSAKGFFDRAENRLEMNANIVVGGSSGQSRDSVLSLFMEFVRI